MIIPILLNITKLESHSDVNDNFFHCYILYLKIIAIKYSYRILGVKKKKKNNLVLLHSVTNYVF